MAKFAAQRKYECPACTSQCGKVHKIMDHMQTCCPDLIEAVVCYLQKVTTLNVQCEYLVSKRKCTYSLVHNSSQMHLIVKLRSFF